jgi:two-component system, cell cycle sensor histidine kinase and response regulator CckA
MCFFFAFNFFSIGPGPSASSVTGAGLPERQAMATGRMSSNQHKRSVLQIARRVSATIGNDFFHAMAKHLAEALAADCVFVGEFIGGQVERVRTLAVFAGSESEDFEYSLAGSASAQIALGNPVLFRSNAQTRFPSDEALAHFHAQAFAGIPLATSEGTPCGVLMALYRRPVPSLRLARSILEIFAPRAASELARKQEEEHIRESEQRYKAFVLLNADAMWRVEFEQPIATDLPAEDQIEMIYRYGYLAECNDACARQFGLENAGQLIGWRINDLAPISHPSMREGTLHAIRSGYRFTTVETTPVDRNGKQLHMLRTQWGIVEEGKLVRIWGSNRDITDLKTVERELDASEQRMADLLETLNLLVVMLQEDGTIVHCNSHLYRLTGWSSADVTGKNWFDLMVPPDDRGTALAAFTSAKLQSEAPTHYESALLGPKGGRWWVAWDSTCLRDADGNIVMSATVGRDISDYKLLEAQYRQAQELESIGRLAGGVAHDFNNLLAVVTGYCSVLLAGMKPSDSAYAGLVEIANAAQKGADLTHRLLAFSRRQTPHLELLNLSALIADDQEMLRRLLGEDVSFSTNLEPSLDLVRADPGQLRQVLLNLVVNARDAMPHGGSLTISTSNARELVQMTVSDTGTGMTQEVRNHLFEPFYTTKELGKGTGLGLSTVYGIIRQAGGEIQVDSEVGQGSSFRISLPALAPNSAESEP